MISRCPIPDDRYILRQPNTHRLNVEGKNADQGYCQERLPSRIRQPPGRRRRKLAAQNVNLKNKTFMNIVARSLLRITAKWIAAGAISAAFLGSTQIALAEGDLAAGRKKSETCLGCHASPNAENTYPMYRVPKVGGQHPEYIAAALKAYRDGTRPHMTMRANAASLSDEDIADIAAFFATVNEEG